MFGAGRTLSFTRIVGLVAGFSACSPNNVEVSSSANTDELATLARENLLRPLRGSAETARFLTQSRPLTLALALSEPPSTPGQIDDDYRDSLEKLDQILRERVLILENQALPSPAAEPGTTSYRIPADLWCANIEKQTPTEGEDAAQEECEVRFNRYTPRLLLRESGSSNVTAELQLGMPPRSLAQFNLFHNKIEANIDFGVIFELTKELHEDLSPFSEFSGRISLSLERLFERRYAFEFQLIDDIRVVFTSHGSLATARLEAGTPISWSLDGRDPGLTTLDAQLNLGKLQVEGALHSFQDFFPAPDPDAPPPAYEGTLRLEFGGLKARAHMDSKEDILHLTDIGLGSTDTQLLIDGKLAAKLQVTAPGRHAVRVDFQAKEQALAALFLTNPQLSLIAEFHNLARQVAHLPESLLSNVFSIQLEGETQGELQFTSGHIQVTQGSLKLESANMPELSQSASNGQCVQLIEDENPTKSTSTGPETPFGQISVGACQ